MEPNAWATLSGGGGTLPGTGTKNQALVFQSEEVRSGLRQIA